MRTGLISKPLVGRTGSGAANALTTPRWLRDKAGALRLIVEDIHFAVPAAPLGIAFIASSTSTSNAISLPAGIQAGDLIVLLDRALTSGGTPALVIPSGFTQISSIIDVAEVRQVVSYKVATGSEGGTSITGMDGVDADRKISAVFRRNPVATSAIVLDISGEMSVAGDPATQVVNASASTSNLIVFGAYGSEGGAPTRTFTPSSDAEISVGTVYLKYKIYNSAPADTNVDLDAPDIYHGLQSFYIELTDAGAADDGDVFGVTGDVAETAAPIPGGEADALIDDGAVPAAADIFDSIDTADPQPEAGEIGFSSVDITDEAAGSDLIESHESLSHEATADAHGTIEDAIAQQPADDDVQGDAAASISDAPADLSDETALQLAVEPPAAPDPLEITGALDTPDARSDDAESINEPTIIDGAIFGLMLPDPFPGDVRAAGERQTHFYEREFAKMRRDLETMRPPWAPELPIVVEDYALDVYDEDELLLILAAAG